MSWVRDQGLAQAYNDEESNRCTEEALG